MAPEVGSIGWIAQMCRRVGDLMPLVDPSCSPDRLFFDRCRLAVIMQRLSEAEWLQVVAPLLHESVSWRVEEALRKEAREIVHHELRHVVDNWHLQHVGPIIIHCGFRDHTFAC